MIISCESYYLKFKKKYIYFYYKNFKFPSIFILLRFLLVYAKLLCKSSINLRQNFLFEMSPKTDDKLQQSNKDSSISLAWCWPLVHALKSCSPVRASTRETAQYTYIYARTRTGPMCHKFDTAGFVNHSANAKERHEKRSS